MVEAGAFGAAWQGRCVELVYWQLGGGHPAGRVTDPFKTDAAAIAAAVDNAAARLRGLVHAYRDPDRAYLAQPHPGLRPRFPDYAQLARLAEWDQGEDAEDSADAEADAAADR